MRILLTGGRGLLGTPLSERLASAHDVLQLDIEEMDVTDSAAVVAVLTDARPDRVLHLAAWTDVDGCEGDPARAHEINAVGARNVAEACAGIGAGLLYVSTDYVFDGSKDGPYDVDDATGPISAYGRSKLAGEEFVRALAPTWWIVRCQSIYGLQRTSFVDAILARAAGGEPLRVVTDQRVSPSYAPDLAEALEAVVLRGTPGVYHASNDGSCTWYECAEAALEIAGLDDVSMASITAAELGRPAPRPANSVFSLDRLEREAGCRLRPWRDALAEYLGARGHGGDA